MHSTPSWHRFFPSLLPSFCSPLKRAMALKSQLCLFSFMFFTSVAFVSASVDSVAVLVDSPLEISCTSALIPPMWTWIGPKQGQPKTLAFSGTQPHHNLKDTRFSFAQSDSNYILRISSVKLSDAGTINCLGDSPHQTLLNVIR